MDLPMPKAKKKKIMKSEIHDLHKTIKNGK